jgi:hypothetical protein
MAARILLLHSDTIGHMKGSRARAVSYWRDGAGPSALQRRVWGLAPRLELARRPRAVDPPRPQIRRVILMRRRHIRRAGLRR